MPTNVLRFSKKLDEQIGFLRRSCMLFDHGSEDEALRIATTLRVLFHDTKNSTSLVSHLGRRDMKMLSSSRGHSDYRDYLAVVIDVSSPEPIRMKPLLGSAFRETTLNRWWGTEPIFVVGAKPYVRRDVILSAANKDGGTHVDAELEQYYKTLSSGVFTLGITGNLTYAGAAPFQQGVTYFPENAHFALLRQFGHEALTSLIYTNRP